MYKLVAIDIDGTLLNSYGELSKENKEAIQNTIKKGVKVVLTSGRMPSSVKKMSIEVGSNEYIIAGNGTMVYDMKKEEIIYKDFMKKEKVLEIVKLLEENSIYFNLYTENNVITKTLDYNTKYYNYENSKKIKEKRTSINIVPNVYQYIKEMERINILKITICDENKIVFNRIIQRLKHIQNIEILEIEHMSKKIIKSGTQEIPIEYFYTEITNKEANKWKAIEFLIKKLAITKEEVMTIGDNINDKIMVEQAGLGITLRNSALNALGIGKFVVSDNNSNGVAEALNTYIK